MHMSCSVFSSSCSVLICVLNLRYPNLKFTYYKLTFSHINTPLITPSEDYTNITAAVSVSRRLCRTLSGSAASRRI